MVVPASAAFLLAAFLLADFSLLLLLLLSLLLCKSRLRSRSRPLKANESSVVSPKLGSIFVVDEVVVAVDVDASVSVSVDDDVNASVSVVRLLRNRS